MDTEQFISSVRKKRSLWDQKNKYHHNRYVLDKLWEEVGKEFNIPRDTARKKWKAIRDKFRIILSKNPKKDNCDRNEYIQSIFWPHFKSLLFLEDQFSTPIPPSNSVFLLSHTENEFHTEEDFKIETHSINSPNSPKSYTVLDSPFNPLQDNPEQTNMSTSSSSFLRGHKRPHQSDMIEQESIELESDKLNWTNDNKNGRVEDEVEDMYFFRSIVSHVKDLPPAKKIAFRMKVLQAVQEVICDQTYLKESST